MKKTNKSGLKIVKIQNINQALTVLIKDGLRLVNVSAEDIQGGNVKCTLGLIWQLILKYQIGDAVIKGSAKDILLKWVKHQIHPYKTGVRLKNFKTGWSDGKVFSALTDSLQGTQNELIDYTQISEDPFEATEHATQTAFDSFEIPLMMDTEDLVLNPDEHSIMTYVSFFRDYYDTMGAKPVANATTAEGSGVEGGDATSLENAEFLITCNNANGDKVEAGGQNIQVVVTGPGGGEKKCAVTDNEDGTWSGCYDIDDGAGSYMVEILLDSNHIQGSPFEAKMSGGSAGQCWAEGDGLENTKTGAKSHFVIHSVKEDGTPMEQGGIDNFVVEINGPDGALENKVIDNQDGTYSCAYCPVQQGEYEVSITLLDEHIKDSPFNVAVKRAPNAAKSFVTGAGLDKAYDNRTSTFTVHAMDDFGDPVWGDLCEVEIIPENPDLDKIEAEVKDNDDGTYTVSYGPSVPGNFEIHCRLDTQDVRGTPHSIRVREGADAKNVGSAKFRVTIMTRNKEGQPKTEGGDDWKVEVRRAKQVLSEAIDNGDPEEEGPEEEVKQVLSEAIDNPEEEVKQVLSEAIDNGDGSYTALYTLERNQDADAEPTEYLVDMLLNGEHISGSPFRQYM